MVRGRIYIQLIWKIKTYQAVLKLTGEEYTGMAVNVLNLSNSDVSSPRHQFNKSNLEIQKERKKSVILEVPKIHELRSFLDSCSDVDGKATSRKPPSKRIKSEFIDWADKDFDTWLEKKRNKATK